MSFGHSDCDPSRVINILWKWRNKEIQRILHQKLFYHSVTSDFTRDIPYWSLFVLFLCYKCTSSSIYCLYTFLRQCTFELFCKAIVLFLPVLFFLLDYFQRCLNIIIFSFFQQMCQMTILSTIHLKKMLRIVIWHTILEMEPKKFFFRLCYL